MIDNQTQLPYWDDRKTLSNGCIALLSEDSVILKESEADIFRETEGSSVTYNSIKEAQEEFDKLK